MLKIAAVLPTATTNNNNMTSSNTCSTKPTKSTSASVEIAPNVVYQVRSKKNKKNK